MKINVAVMFGGKSVEHEISVISALQAAEYLNKDKYQVIPIYISKQGKMYTGEQIGKIAAYKNIDTLLKNSTQIVLTNEDGKVVMTPYRPRHQRGRRHAAGLFEDSGRSLRRLRCAGLRCGYG